MPRRMARRSGRAGGKNRYAWHGFYMATPLTPADTIEDVFVLYDAIDDDHQEEVVLERTIIHMQCSNPNTSAGGRIGFGLYLGTRNNAGAMSSDINTLGVSAFDVEANWQLWHKIVHMPQAISGQADVQYEYDFNAKAKRKIEDPQFLILVVRGDTASSWKYQFQARALVKEGRF